MVLFKDIDDVVSWCWQEHFSVNQLNEVIRAENKGEPYSQYYVKSPILHGSLEKAAASLDNLPGEPEKIEEVRGKLAAACNAGLYLSLDLMNSFLVLHDQYSLEQTAKAASKYASCLESLGLDVPEEALKIDSSIMSQKKQLSIHHTQTEIEEWLASWMCKDEAAEFRTAIIGLYNSFVSVYEDFTTFIAAVREASERVRNAPLGYGINANTREALLSSVYMYLSANEAAKAMISNAQNSLKERNWYMQEFEPVEKPAWAKKLS